MEISERKKQILSALIKSYIASGEPIGSKVLAEILIGAPSSATIRNEMNELGKIGFLTQPHTSAGRIPTPLGYRFYVNSLMDEDLISDNARSLIDGAIKDTGHKEQAVNSAIKLLSKITGLTAVCIDITDESEKIKDIDIFKVAENYYAVVALTSFLRQKAEIIRVDADISESAFTELRRKARLIVLGKPLCELTPAFLQSILTSLSLTELEAIPLINALIGILSDSSVSKIKACGELNLFSMLKTEKEARDVLAFLENSEGLIGLAGENKEKVNVIFGSDTPFKELKPLAVILASYGKKDMPLGKIGVIGPTRMSYEQIIPVVEYVADKLS